MVKVPVRKLEKCDSINDDQEQLQALDEFNAEWVIQWKKTVGRKKEVIDDSTSIASVQIDRLIFFHYSFWFFCWFACFCWGSV